MEQSFYDWLMEQLDRRGPIGAFALAANEDEDFPRQASSRKVIRRYLTSIEAPPETFEAFDDAFNLYMEDERVH